MNDSAPNAPTFADLGVPDFISRALAERGIHQPFEIQAATIADALDGRDVCGRAPTGSGKTLAFGIPLVATIERAEPRRPRGLILAPTRELAEQITTELRSFAGRTRIGVVYGGVGYGPQLSALRNGVDILVACPGRLEDLLQQGALSLEDVDKIVLDEADRMADMGFMPAVKRLLNQTRDKRQTVLFSATLDGDVKKLTQQYQTNPVRHEVGEETPDITSASHFFWKVAKADRAALTAEAVNAVWPAIVFCRTRHGADRLAKQLGRSGIEAAAIHGGRSQNQRTRALGDFAKGRVHALVATDVAARGIHVDGVASVIHYDPPEDHKTYIHRSGRTARAGEGGVVVSFVQPDQHKDTRKVQRQVGLDEQITEPDPVELRSYSPAPGRKLEPRPPREEQAGGGGGGGGNRRKRGPGPSGKPRRTGGGGGKGANNRSGGGGQGGRDRNDSSGSGAGKPRNGRGQAGNSAKRSTSPARSGAGQRRTSGRPAR